MRPATPKHQVSEMKLLVAADPVPLPRFFFWCCFISPVSPVSPLKWKQKERRYRYYKIYKYFVTVPGSRMRRCSRLLLVPNGQKASARRHSVGSVGMAGKAVVYRDVQSIFGATLSWCRNRRETVEKPQRNRRETAEKAVETSTEARSSGKLNITEERKAFDTQDRSHFMAQVHLLYVL